VVLSRRFTILAVALGLMVVVGLAGCGGGGDGGATGTVSGYVYSPNGQYPVPNALAYIQGQSSLADYTDATGLFSIEDVPSGAQVLIVIAGSFQVTLNINVIGGQDNVVAPASDPIQMGVEPGSNEVKMAVAEGAFDTIEEILSALGFPELSAPTDPGTGYVMYDTIADVLSDTDLLDQYDIIFLNCGTDESPADDATQMQNLRNWVAAGGSLYASDYAYWFVETGWPDAINFYGEDALDEARIGEAETVTARVLDPVLQAVLGSPTAQIEFNLGGWVVIEPGAQGSGTDVLMEADVHVYDFGLKAAADRLAARAATRQTLVEDSPILVRFARGSGNVIYTCFHNEAQVTDEMMAILRTLVFHL